MLQGPGSPDWQELGLGLSWEQEGAEVQPRGSPRTLWMLRIWGRGFGLQKGSKGPGILCELPPCTLPRASLSPSPAGGRAVRQPGGQGTAPSPTTGGTECVGALHAAGVLGSPVPPGDPQAAGFSPARCPAPGSAACSSCDRQHASTHPCTACPPQTPEASALLAPMLKFWGQQLQNCHFGYACASCGR